MDQLKKRKREQEKQKRNRLVQSKADPFPSQIDSHSIPPPKFPSLIKKSDGHSDELTRMTKTILGPYDACQVAMQSMNHNQQQQLLGTFEATPSTPLQVTRGNPFDRQFSSSSSTSSGLASGTTTTAPPSTKGSSSASGSTSSSATQSRGELNRHSVAEPPTSGGRGEERGGKPRSTTGHVRSDHSAKGNKLSSDSPFLMPKPSYKKGTGKSQLEGGAALSGEAGGSRPSNVLPVRKKEKGRIRPFKSTGGGGGGGSSPTANQQGSTQPKKSSGPGGVAQGAGDLFKVETETGAPPPKSTGSEGVSRTSTSPAPPTSSKRPPKLKKRHSHHSLMSTPPSNSATTPTGDVTGILSQAIRKSNSVQSHTSILPPPPSSSSSTPHHKHRKQSSSTTSTTHSSSHHPPSSSSHPSTHPPSSSHPSTHHPPSSTHPSTHHPPSSSQPPPPHPVKKQESAPLLSLHQPSSEKKTGAVTVKRELPTTLDQQPTPTVHIPSTSTSTSSSLSSSTHQAGARRDHSQVGRVSEERLAKKKKRKKAKRERERMQLGQSSVEERGNVVKTEHVSNPVSEPTKPSLSGGHDIHQTQQVRSHSVPGQTMRTLSSKERVGKPRPSNLIIDAYGDSTEESSMDIRDVQILLKELMSNVSVPSPITPLPTPSTPFTFPTSSVTGGIKLESIPEAPPIGPAYPLSDSDNSSSASSSSGSSSESSDEEEDETNEQGQEREKGGSVSATTTSMEEGDDNTTPGWDKVFPSVGDSITPLKKTPPYPSAATTPQLSSIVPSAFQLAGISPLDTPVRPHPTTTTSASSMFQLTSPPPPPPPPPPPHSTASTTTGSGGSASSARSVSSRGSGLSSSTVGGFVLGTNVLRSQSVSSATTDSASFFAAATDGIVYNQPPAISDEVTPMLTDSEDTMLSGGFPVVSVTGQEHAPSATVQEGGVSSSESEGEESGSESDDEMSEDEDSSSSGEEEEDGEGGEEGGPNSEGRPPNERLTAPKPSIGGSSSVLSAPFFSGDDSFSFQGGSYGGFFNDEDFLSGLQGNVEESQRVTTEGEERASMNPQAGSTQWFSNMATGDTQTEASSRAGRDGGTGDPKPTAIPPLQQGTVPHPPSSSSSTSDNANPLLQSGGGAAADTKPSLESSSSVRTLPHQLSLDSGVSLRGNSGGKKRKLERQASLDDTEQQHPQPSPRLQPPARKAPRTLSSAPGRRRDSSVSSLSVSSDSSMDDSSDSSDEEQSDDKSTTLRHPPITQSPSSSLFHHQPPLLPTSVAHLTTTTLPPQPHSTSIPSLTSSLPATTVSHSLQTPQPQRQQQLEAGELEEEEDEEGGGGGGGKEGWTEEGEAMGMGQLEHLWVKISLQKVDYQREQKPKAKVEPYNVTAPSKPQPRRRSTIDSSGHEDLSRLPCVHHGVDHDGRTVYSRQRDREEDHHIQYSRADFHRDDGRRSHRGSGGWESGRDREGSWSGGRHGVRVNRAHDRERDHHRNRNWEDYDGYDTARSRNRSHPTNRNMSAEECLREARKRKHDADRRAPGFEKAKGYLESVVYFMRHGDAIEREAQAWDGAQTKNPFRLYMDTITLIKYCRNWASDCKQLLALCMRCLSVLYWKLFLLKQTTAGNLQKDLQDFFVPSKGAQKSPYACSLSPIPSPASVGSTASTGSGVGGASSVGSTQDPSPSSHVTVPKLVFNKASEHLAITGYLHQSMEHWAQGNLIVEQYRDFFSALDRRSGRITQFSPIAVVADWLETGARLIRYHS